MYITMFKFKLQIFVIFFCTIILLALNATRTKKIPSANISLIQLAEFDNLNNDIKEFYKIFILESWIKAFNETLNKSVEVNGLDEYYKKNKKKLIELNNLYLDMFKLGIEKKDKLIKDDLKVMVYNADLDKLINEAKIRKAELEAI